MKTSLLVTMFFVGASLVRAGGYKPSLDSSSSCAASTTCIFTFDDLNPAYSYEYTFTDSTNPSNNTNGEITASSPSFGVFDVTGGDSVEVTLVEIHKNGNDGNHAVVDVSLTVGD